MKSSLRATFVVCIAKFQDYLDSSIRLTAKAYRSRLVERRPHLAAVRAGVQKGAGACRNSSEKQHG